MLCAPHGYLTNSLIGSSEERIIISCLHLENWELREVPALAKAELISGPGAKLLPSLTPCAASEPVSPANSFSLQGCTLIAKAEAALPKT